MSGFSTGIYDLRRPVMLSRMKTRHRAYQIVRNYLSGQGFFEVERPCWPSHTPRGRGITWFPAGFMRIIFMRCPSRRSCSNNC